MDTNCSSCSSGLLKTFEYIAETAQDEIEALKEKNAELEALVRDLNEKMANGDLTDMESILTSIVGSWNIISSIGMEEFMKEWGTLKEIDAVFQAATHTFEFTGDTVTITYTVGTTVHWKGTEKIGEKTSTSLTLVDENMLVSVYFNKEEEYMRLERFVRNGQLHIVAKRFGMKCTRIYEKVGSKDPEALSKRIAELEAELEKLKEEREDDKRVYEADKKAKEWINNECSKRITKLSYKLSELKSERDEEKQKYITDIGANVEMIVDLNDAILDLTDELEQLSVEKDNEKKKFEADLADHSKLIEQLDNVADDLINEREETKRHKELYLEKTLEVQDLVAKLGELEVEREAMKRELEEKRKEFMLLRKDGPIETSILGTWKLIKNSPTPYYITVSIKDGNLIEQSTGNPKLIRPLNCVDHGYSSSQFAFTSVENNQLISVISDKRSGEWLFSIARSVEKGLLKLVIKDCLDKEITTSTFERVV